MHGLLAGVGAIQNSSSNNSITSSMEPPPHPPQPPVMRDLAFRLCYSIMEQLMKKTTSSLLIPKIRFPLIKCQRWRRASSDLTKVPLNVPPLQMGGVVRKSGSPKINASRSGGGGGVGGGGRTHCGAEWRKMERRRLRRKEGTAR